MPHGLWFTVACLSAPPPAAAPPVPVAMTDHEAVQFGQSLVPLATRIEREYHRPVSYADLARAAARGLYRAAGMRPAAAVDADAAKVTIPSELTAFLARTRRELGHRPDLAEPFDYLAAVGGFSSVLDPYCEPVLGSAGGSIGRSGVEAVLGAEFAGVDNDWWITRLVVVKPNPFTAVVPSATPRTAAFTGTVARVQPGGVLARAGIKPGDRVVSVAGERFAPDRFEEVVRIVQSTHAAYLSAVLRDDVPPSAKIPVTVERHGATKRLDLPLDRDPDRTDAVFGSTRTDSGEWSYLLPRVWGGPKLGFLRLGVLDVGAATQVRDAIRSLEGEKVEGIVLDLRGCPGGYVSEAALIAELFVPSGKVLYSVKGREGEPAKTIAKASAGFGHALPLLVLADATTRGGGELIAAAIQGYGRAPVAGQRTFGKGVVMTTDTTAYSGLLYRLTTGIALRPDGTDRHRYPDSKPTDPWGVRPDPGYEIATTRGYAERMNGWYELHTSRPWKGTDVTPLDDPLNDPVLGIAAKKLGVIVQQAGVKQ